MRFENGTDRRRRQKYLQYKCINAHIFKDGLIYLALLGGEKRDFSLRAWSGFALPGALMLLRLVE
jgi:hypothetical protein